jgi:membrane-bound ClpP family serine protease
MYIGGSLILLTIGAVLAFAVEEDFVSGIDLAMVGYIFMAVGALGLIISLVVSGQHRGRVPPR